MTGCESSLRKRKKEKKSETREGTRGHETNVSDAAAEAELRQGATNVTDVFTAAQHY